MGGKTEMIAYCGLYCELCPAYVGVLANLAEQLQGELKQHLPAQAVASMAKMPPFAAFAHFEQFEAVLAAIKTMRCTKHCQAGGGSPDCKIRRCAQGKGLAGCWECDALETCETLGALDEFGDAEKSYLTNLRKLKQDGPEAFVAGQSA